MSADPLSVTRQLSALVEGCKRFDRRSQQLLYEKYYGFSLKATFRYLDTYEQAVDAVHHSFLKVFRGFPSFVAGQCDKLEPSLTRWIRRNAVETAVSSLLPGLFSCTANSVPESMEGLLANDGQEDDFCRLIEALRRLPLVYRTVFNLYVIDEYSHEEVAALLGVTTQVSELFVYEARLLLGAIVPSFDTLSTHTKEQPP
ncbi:MAG TPA: sigma-70 family RNA polymerase sigma factor [Puia sp.]|nr:sigma-70 family RNA polymerase sigma factor [Puia sp.]